MKNTSIAIALLIVASPLALFASPATDHKIETTAKTSYNYRTVLDNTVKVKAKDGVVTLTGTVQDKDDKALAADTVENIPGVVSVKNEIVVKNAPDEHSDAWIALKVRGTLLVKSNVSATATKVAVNDGVVTLTGTADNIAQKELTGVYAGEIDWVKSVDNQIVVTDTPASTTIGEKIDDASITSQVKFALLGNKATSALNTKVTTNDGVVTLIGEAETEAEKSLAGKLAGNIRGVTSVNNNMTIEN